MRPLTVNLSALVRVGLGAVLGLLLLGGCSSTPQPHRPVPRFVPRQHVDASLAAAAATAPSSRPPAVVAVPAAPAAPDVIESFSSRTLQPGDKLTITLIVPGLAQPMTFQAVVDEFGSLNLPLINQIKVSGRTKSESEKMIEKAYVDGEFYRVVTVIIIPPEVEYYVRGAVQRPGGYPMVRDLTVTRALAIAGGYTEYADPTSIRVSRANRTFQLNARKIETGEDSDPTVQPGDVIVVKEKWY